MHFSAFRATVVKSFSEFWVGVQSDAVTVEVSFTLLKAAGSHPNEAIAYISI
jgi:hypothetical protein